MFDLEIVGNSLKIYNQSILPALQITVKYKLSQETLPLVIKGAAYTEDNKFISQLIELPPVDTRNNISPNRENGDLKAKSPI